MTFTERIVDLVDLQPDHIWIEPGLALFGWGNGDNVEVGTGPDRYVRAAEITRAGGHQIAFASFTFDVDEPGSFVVAPSTMIAVDGNSVEVLKGEFPVAVEHPAEIPVVAGGPDAALGWEQGFDLAMEGLAGTSLEKVVLSRTVDISFDRELHQASVVRSLLRDQMGSYVFALDGLVGSSPELLARLDGTTLQSVSLAGSMARNAGNGSLSSAKNRREHELAAESVAAALRSITTSLTRGPVHEASFAHIVHLATSFEGQAAPGTTILDLVARLHPTAAVAGTPTAEAVSLIRDLEAHQRGRYAGPVGWFDSEGNGTFAIALRCGLIRGKGITLFTGAGLVEGSLAGVEYAETEIKLMPMLRALGLS